MLFVSDVSHMIHILDTEHPWDVYSINSGHSEIISSLEWDQSGVSMFIYYSLMTLIQYSQKVSVGLSVAFVNANYDLISSSTNLLSDEDETQRKCWSCDEDFN